MSRRITMNNVGSSVYVLLTAKFANLSFIERRYLIKEGLVFEGGELTSLGKQKLRSLNAASGSIATTGEKKARSYCLTVNRTPDLYDVYHSPARFLKEII